MAERDGTIVIDTQIDTKGVDAGSEKTEASLRRMAKKVNDIGATAKAALNKQIDAFAKLNNEYAAQEQKVERLRQKVAEYGNQKIPTDEYKEIQAQIEQAAVKLNRLKEAQERYIAGGGKKNSNTYRRQVYDMEELANTIKYAEGELKDLEETGKAFTIGNRTKEAMSDAEKLEQAERKLCDMHNKLQTAYDGVNDKINEYSQKADEATASTSRLSRIGGMVGKAIGSIATFGKNAAKSLTGAKKSSSGFGLSLGTLVKYGFGIRSLYVLVNKLRSALVDGFKNLSQYSGETNGSISMLWSSLERLKNSLATAFAPILTVVAPILSKFIDMLSTAASYVSMFFSFLSGKSTYTRAIAVQKNYAASLGDTASAAKDAADATEDAAKAAEDYLSPLDDINKFTAEDSPSSKTPSSGSGSGGTGATGPMFEDVPIESNIKKIFQKIKDLIKSGDFEGLGEMMADAINRGLEKVKKAISWDNVGPTVTYFVTGFTRTFNSLVDNIDWDLLGRTIGTGINTIVNTLDLFYTGIDWKNLGNKFADGVNGVVYEVDWAKLGQFIGHKILALPTIIVGFVENLDWSALSKAASTLILNFLDTLIEFIHNIDWSKIVTNVQDALTNIQWIAIAEKILELLGYALGSITGALARLIGNLIAQGASEAYQYFEDKIKEAGGNVVDGILLGILDALLGIGSWIVDNVFKPILDGFKNAFGIHSPSTVMQEQGHYIIEGLLLGITDFLSKIKKKFEEIRNIVTEKMDNIKSSAVSKVNEMKKGLSNGVGRIKESFRSGFSTLVGYVKSPINSIIRFINNFLYAIQTMQNSFANALNSMSISLPHWLEKLTGFSSVGFNVGYWSAPMVPYLAQGAVIPPNKEFMAVLGDQKSGNNIEAPESLIRRIVREESGNGKGSTYNVTAQVNRRTLFDLVLEEGKVRRTVTGRNPFETV